MIYSFSPFKGNGDESKFQGAAHELYTFLDGKYHPRSFPSTQVQGHPGLKNAFSNGPSIEDKKMER